MKNSEHICLLLGAGVTGEQKMPGWKELVSDMNDYYDLSIEVTDNNVTECIGIIENRIINYIENKCSVSNDRAKQWARCQIAASVRMSFKKRLAKRSFNNFEDSMKLIKVIVNKAFRRARKGLRTTIITYNFDDYFEFAYKTKHPKYYDEHVAIHGLGAPRYLPTGGSDKLINVYHVHGRISIFDEMYGYKKVNIDKFSYIEQNWEQYKQDMYDGIIFSGNDYVTLMDNKILGWTNVIQDICYTQLPLVIVGFSMSDANFRLLLRRMKRSEESMKQIVFLLGYSSGNDKKAEAEITSIEYLLRDICSNLDCRKFVYDDIPNALKHAFKKYE